MGGWTFFVVGEGRGLDWDDFIKVWLEILGPH